jgi:hypothetical protein
MHKRIAVIWVFVLTVGFSVFGQGSNPVSVKFIKQNLSVLPNEVVNIPFFVINNSSSPISLKLDVGLPSGWSSITKLELDHLNPNEQKFLVISTRIPVTCAVGDYKLSTKVYDLNSDNVVSATSAIHVSEVEKIVLELIASSENIRAGETFKAQYLIQNMGNSEKTVFIETSNCEVAGEVNVRLKPGESKNINVVKETSDELTSTQKEFVSVRAMLAGEVMDRVFHTMFIFPVKTFRQDLFFRYPIDASVSYLASNQNDSYEWASQLEISGNGFLDQQSEHHLEFLIRGPNNSNLSYLGLYDQYYVAYENKNVEFTLGQQSYKFTPLTESSRFGFGVENKVKLNNGLSAGFIYVKPRFYEEIENELAVYSQFEKDEYNRITLFAVQKKNNGINDLTYLFSLGAAFQPFKKTTVELEASRGFWGDVADNAYRANLNSQFSIFNVGGSYNYAGKNYPGYYTNSTFYSAALSAQIHPKINVGLYARQDFSNAELDTFFVTAPYSRSMQYFVNYNIVSQAYLKIYWNESERKDRLSAEKFHYETRSLNSQFSQRIKRFSYSLHGAYGETTNYLLSEVSNKQNTYLVSTNLAYQLSNKHSVRAFGTYSNLNSFVTGDQRDVTAGLAVNSQVMKKLKASAYLQNAYNIDDYYRNRNLMQLQFDYSFSRNSNLILRAYNTLFKTETENSEFFVSATYKQQIGVPLKQTMQVGDVSGRITRSDSEPLEGIVVSLLNKTTLTGQNGEFRFRSIPPGIHLLSIDRSEFAIDEMPNVPLPLQLEVLANDETNLNIGITKGARLYGRFVLKGKPPRLPEMGSILLELKSEFNTYRIPTNADGEFSFPLVLPGTWTFRIYDNSIPDGFEVDKQIYEMKLRPDEQFELLVDIQAKERKIVFQNQNVSLSGSGTQGLNSLSLSNKTKPVSSKKTDDLFYSIQVGTFSKRLDSNSSFFKGYGFEIEKQLNNFYKYFIGHYSTLREANEANKKLKKEFKGAFVVYFKNNEPVDINDR